MTSLDGMKITALETVRQFHAPAYFPRPVNKTVSDFFLQRCKCLFMYVHIFYYFSIYWSDTSLSSTKHEILTALKK